MRLKFLAIVSSILVAFAPAASASAQTAVAPPHPAEAFAALPGVVGPKLSPNGRRLATRISKDGAVYLMILPIDGSAPSLISTRGSDLNWWRWVNDDWLVVGIGDKRPFADNEAYVTRALGVSADGRTVNPLLDRLRDMGQQGDDVIWTAHDGSPRILVSVQRSIYSDDIKFWPQVYEVNVATGRFDLKVDSHEGVFEWVADATGAVRIGVGSDRAGDQNRILHRAAGQTNFRNFPGKDSAGKDAKYPKVILADGRGIAIADDPNGFSVVYEYDLAAMKPGRVIHASSGYDIEGFRTDTAQTRLLGVSVAEASGSVRWLDPAMLALQAEINGLVKGASGAIVSTSSDLNRSVVLFSSADGPGAYFLYDRPSGAMKQLAFVNPALKMAKLNPVKMIRYKARDGLDIEAVLTLPRSRPAQKLPLIVLPHGGPFARDDVSWDWWTQFLADRGYAVVQPNYRGSSGYGTAFSDRGEGEWGLKMQDDLIDSITHLAGLGIADPKRVCIAGASYGGYAAMRAAQRDSSHYRCAISYAGVSDLKRLTKYSFRELFSGKSKAWLRKQAPDLSAVSPINTPERTAIPLLLVHGRKDTRVTVDHSRLFAAKAKSAGRDVIYIEQPEADHHFSRAADRLQFLKAMEAFLARHNPA